MADCSRSNQLDALWLEIDDAFAWDDPNVGLTDVLQQHIDTGTAAPIHFPPRRGHMHCKEELWDFIQRMLNPDGIRPSVSDWAIPIVLAKKRDGALHLCVYYRRLNSATKTRFS